jgi:ParB-like chromosome segregation protein Spo0J
LDEEKVQNLIESYKKTGMWIGVVGRQDNNNIQIAFGHHRIEAARMMKYNTIDVDVREISDSDMIRMMADENMDRKINTAVIVQTVLSAKQFLEKEIRDPAKSTFDWLFARMEEKEKATKRGVGEQPLMKFLGKEWQRNINIALRTINDETIDKKAVEVFEKPAHADTIRAKLKEHNVPKEKQKEYAEKVKETIEKSVPPSAKKENKKAEVTSQKIKDVMDDEFFGTSFKKEKKKKRPDINDKLDLYTKDLANINLGLKLVLDNSDFAEDSKLVKFASEVNIFIKIINAGAKTCQKIRLIK